MRFKHTHLFATTLCAFALITGRAAPAFAQNKSPPPSDQSASASSAHAERTGKEDREGTMPFEPGDTIFCTISQGKEKSRTARIDISPGRTADELCPPGGRITGFIVHADHVRHVPPTFGTAPPVGGELP